MSKAEERAFNEVALNESRKYYPISQKMSDEEKEMYAAKQVAFQVGFKAGAKWNEEELTDFENAMLHVGNSFFGKYSVSINGGGPNEVEYKVPADNYRQWARIFTRMAMEMWANMDATLNQEEGRK